MAETEQADMQGMLTRWQTLKKQAEGGEFRLDEQIGQDLARHAEQMRTKLQNMLNKAGELEHLSGFGSLTSAGDLRNKFALKANNGDDSAVKRLKQSIDVVILMKETYELAIGKLKESDQSAADRLAALNAGGS
ncbi:hypothetical protein [Nocardia iowensis]|uniref:DUF2383 domain-containing protein n=1 Tax=Nocardia iowensis TaxID=204891 RepID=A0ABX8RT89_NOCIO|nr:hypothetical protein [Nocardia iowensis]QXN92860.1 hypothetical protein KV110_07010 [Nocardia iowensis]